RWGREGNGARLVVQDTGIGIAPQHLPRLTERFYRVDRARARAKGGSGLGLSIVKHGLQRHGGRLEIESEEGRGSTFTAHFPARRVLVRPAAVTIAS
ncbi:MAG TPA: ATP-binding protein, partial [Vicinamibacterales bacterium]|nr:ATP-binding protein [Vicinamibacterales bacterium]